MHSSLLLIACLLPGGLPFQAPARVIRLTTPDTRLNEEFSAVRGVRELPDGRVLVSDYRDQRVVVVDFDRRTVTRSVGRGSGPLEARLPTALVAAPGDSTILVDLGNQRLIVLDPNGRVARTIAGDEPGIMGVRAIDAAGRFYFAMPAWMERDPLPNDSVRIVRRDPATGARTPVAVIQGERMRSDIGQPSRAPRIPVVGYATRDVWVLGDQGAIRIVRGATYQVETIAPDGRSTRGPGYAYRTAPVTTADKLAFVRRFNASSPTSGRGENGGMGFSPAMDEQETREMAARTEFAERHPMFNAGDVLAAPGGRLWVGRPAPDDGPVRYDVFDGAGLRVLEVELGPGRRVAAAGPRHLYVVAEAEDGLQYLERYRMPPQR